MTVNLFTGKAMAGMRQRTAEVESRQAIVREEVARSKEGRIAPKNSNSVTSSAANLNRESELQRHAPRKRALNSDNLLPTNALRRREWFINEKSTGEILPKSVRMRTLVRWLKFNFVGAIGIGVQFFALFVLKTILHFDYLFATAGAVEAAVVHNFLWHEQFTWADRTRPDRVRASWRESLPRLARFNLTTGAVSIVGNLALMKVMVGMGRLNYLVANAIAIALCSLANFLVSDEWVFADAKNSLSS